MARDEALRQIESMLPVGQWRKLEQGGVQGSAIYEFDDAPATGGASKSSAEFGVSSLMETLVERADALDIEDWGISQSSLEEVFLNIVKDEDADASAT